MEHRNDPYAGADLPRAQRFTRALWTGGVVVMLGIVPFYPPTEAFGDVGWLIVSPLLLVVAATIFTAFRPSTGFRGLLYVTYGGFVIVAMLAMLASRDAPYDEIFLLLVCAVALMHPLKISMPYALFVVTVHVLLTILQAGELTEAAMQALVWVVLAGVLTFVMSETRAQRLQLEIERSVDSLTGLLNRRQFDERLEAAVASHAASGVPLSLIIADVNGFKALNDQHGHMAGDAQLIQIADALVAGVRPDDTCFRWGGDEFAVILPGADSTTAGLVGARAREVVADACLLPGRLTIGVGHADLREGDDADDLLARADAMLLAVKAARRRPVSARRPQLDSPPRAVSSAG